MTRLTLRYLRAEDLPFADSLRQMAGWNQTTADWQRFLDLSPNGCLIAELDGQPAATATTIQYGNEVGWIGMLLVHPDFRRRGIARVMLSHCIERLKAGGVRSIKLDATPEGREVYVGLGFQDEFKLTRYSGTLLGDDSTSQLRPADEADLPQIIELDARAFGTDRPSLLARLLRESPLALVSEVPGRILAFGFQRNGSLATYLGPIAGEPAACAQIADSLARECDKFFCDLPDSNVVAVKWAQSRGLRPQRTLIRMFLSCNVPSPSPGEQFSIAAPELG